MSDNGGTVVRGDEQQFRETDASDIGGSVPSHSRSSLVREDSPLSKNANQIPEEIRQAAREQSLARHVREEYEGEGFAIVNTRTGRIVDIVGDLQEARSVLESEELGADDSLVVSCYER